MMMWGAMSSAGVGPLCLINATVDQDILEHFMLPAADKLYGDLPTLPMVRKPGSMTMGLLCLILTVLG